MQDIKHQRITSESTKNTKQPKKTKQIKVGSTYVTGRGHEKIEKSFDKKNTKLAKIVNSNQK